MPNEVAKAKQALDQFSARGSKCPICKKEFRTGCDHSVTQAKDRLLKNYIQAIAKSNIT
jgi:galactose-1-phosphate uridylyltransferase